MNKTNVFGWLVSGLLVVGLPGPVTGFQDDGNCMWDQFLGPAGNGHSTATNLPTNLDDAANIEWRVDIPGRAWSSPLILEDEIWITTAIETEATGDALAEKMEQADIGGMTAWDSVQLQAIRLKRSDGSIQQTVDLFRIDDPPLIHSLNSFASPTPVADDETVYCHFGAFGTAAVDRRTGNVNWRNTENVIDHQTGPGSSPILNGEMLILHCDGCDQQYVCALDTKSGEQLWRTDRSGEMHPEGMYNKAFCTPIVIERGGNLELISPAANWVYGYNPANGEELWRVTYGQLGFSNVARPLVDQETLYVCSCFMQSRLLAIDQ